MFLRNTTTMAPEVLIKKFQTSTANAVPAFVLRNLWCGRKLVPFAPAKFGPCTIEAMQPEALACVSATYSRLTSGARLERKKLATLLLLGPKLCLLARDAGSGNVVGMALYYFNERDRRENTIHEGYIGLHEAMRGQRLGTFMRRQAILHFSKAGLCGMSSRVSCCNLPSLRSGLKLGFEVAETYFDHTWGEERHYLICNFCRAIDSPMTRKGTCQ